MHVYMHRFTPEEKAKRHPCAHLPFGHGPRSCIGMRFALLEAKMALIEIVSKFRIVLAPETKVSSSLFTNSSCSVHAIDVKPGLFTWHHMGSVIRGK